MNRVIEKYRKAGLKLTPQRLAILKFLEGNTSHPSADEIFKAVKREYPTISFSTVYNTIDALKKRGEIMELTIDPAKRHYDPNTTPHHHVVCVECGRIGDVFDEEVDAKIEVPPLSGFRITGWHIDFSGVCSECEQKNGEVVQGEEKEV